MSVTTRIGDRIGLDRISVLWGLLLLDVEILVLTAYYVTFRVTDPFILVFPVVWINVALWAISTTRIPDVGRRARYLGIGIGVGYFLLLAIAGGLVRPGHAFHGHTHMFGARWAWPLPPGWGPMFVYSGAWIGLELTVYELLGYAALAYLVFATVLDAARSALVGLVGVFSCVSCTWPVVGTVVAGLFGGTSGATAVAFDLSYQLSTVVFLSSIALLKWRPSFGK